MCAKRRTKGEGSIFQRANGTYCAKYNGKCKYAKTKLLARDALEELKREANAAPNVEYTVKDLMTKWLRVKIMSVKATSFDRLESTVKCNILNRVGEMNIEDVDSDTFLSMVLEPMKQEGMAYSSIKKAYDAFNACMKYSFAQGMISRNPMAGIEAPKKSAYEMAEDSDGTVFCLSQEQRKNFVYAANSIFSTGRKRFTNSDAYILLLHTGMRMGELLSLKWSNVDMESNSIRINSTLGMVKDRDIGSDTYGRKVLRVLPSTKMSRPRVIPINSAALELLASLKGEAAQKNSVFVVSNSKGGVVRPNTFEKAFASICDLAGIELPKGANVHILRHTFASMLFEKGVNVRIVSELMGHANVQVTMNTYIHLIQDQNLKAISMIDLDI